MERDGVSWPRWAVVTWICVAALAMVLQLFVALTAAQDWSAFATQRAVQVSNVKVTILDVLPSARPYEPGSHRELTMEPHWRVELLTDWGLTTAWLPMTPTVEIMLRAMGSESFRVSGWRRRSTSRFNTTHIWPVHTFAGVDVQEGR